MTKNTLLLACKRTQTSLVHNHDVEALVSHIRCTVTLKAWFHVKIKLF